MASLCHPWFTTTNLSYRFPIFETSATALCGTTGNKHQPSSNFKILALCTWCWPLTPNFSNIQQLPGDFPSTTSTGLGANGGTAATAPTPSANVAASGGHGTSTGTGPSTGGDSAGGDGAGGDSGAGSSTGSGSGRADWGQGAQGGTGAVVAAERLIWGCIKTNLAIFGGWTSIYQLFGVH